LLDLAAGIVFNTTTDFLCPSDHSFVSGNEGKDFPSERKEIVLNKCASAGFFKKPKRARF
jgi:hypothetical protein